MRKFEKVADGITAEMMVLVAGWSQMVIRVRFFRMSTCPRLDKRHDLSNGRVVLNNYGPNFFLIVFVT